MGQPILEGVAFRGTVLVASAGEIMLGKGYGMANDDLQGSNKHGNRFHLHWLTIQFIATVILMLP